MSVRTTLGLDPPVSPGQAVALAPGRSLWGDAWLRLRRNKAAVASGIFLILMTLACLVVPGLLPHTYSDVFDDYTKVGPSLSSYPFAASNDRDIERVLGGRIESYVFTSVAQSTQPFVIGQPRATSVGRVEIRVTRAGELPEDAADQVSALASFDNAVVTPAEGGAVVTADVAVADILQGALDRALRRARVNLASYEFTADRKQVTINLSSASRAIDPRIGEYVDRSDLFADTVVVTMAEDRLSAQLQTYVTPELFLFGTDTNGRDMLARTLVAGRISLTIGILATAVALMVGVAYGAIAGYAGGRVDLLMMRIVDILYSLPFIFFVILLIVFFGRNWILMFVAVGAIEWLDMARIVRGQTLSLKRREYVEAAHAMGVGGGGILRRHVVPNLLGPVVVYVTLLVPKVILLESFLSFLSLGVQEPMTSWGVLIALGEQNLRGAAYLLIFPSLFLISTLFALNFLGDGLRDALDPRDR